MLQRMVFAAIVIFGWWLCGQNAFAQSAQCPGGVLDATTYAGMVPNVKSQDSAPLLAQAIDYVQQNPSCTEITVARGRYYFYTAEKSANQPKETSYISLQGLNGVTLDLNGSELLFDNPYYVGIYIYGCAACVIENFAMDYQNLPFTQLIVTGPPSGQTIPVTPEAAQRGSYSTPNQLYEYYAFSPPHLISKVAFYGFDFRPAAPGGRPLPQYAWGRWDIEPPATLTGALTVAPGEDVSSIQTGDIFVLAARGGGPGIWVQNSPGTRLQSLSIYTSGGPGIISESSDNLTFLGVHVVPKPGTNRLVSTAAGGIELNDIGSNNQVRASEIVGAQDDSIAGYSSALGQVGSVDGDEVTFTAPLPSSLPSQVFFVNGTTALPVANGQIFAIAADPQNDEKATLSPTPSSQGLRGALMFDADPAGRGAGLLISHNTIEYSALARGIALSGMSGVTIADNTIAYTQQAGVVINNDLYDGFGPNLQVKITGNDLQNVNSGMAGIGGGMLGAIETLTLNDVNKGTVVETSPNRQITIVGNRITDTPRSGIWMDNVGGGLISDNSLTCTSSSPTTGEDPHLPSGLGKTTAEYLFAHPIVFPNSKGVNHQGNSVASCSGQ